MHAGDARWCPQDHPHLHERRTQLQNRRGEQRVVGVVHVGNADVFGHHDHQLPDAFGRKSPFIQIQVFTFAKKYHSYTKYQASFCLYYSLFYIINACCLVYLVHGATKENTA